MIKSTQYIVIIFVFTQLNLIGQKYIFGKLVEINNYNLPFIQGVIMDDNTIVSDFLTDSLGNWKVKIDPLNNKLKIRFSSIGCKDTIFNIQSDWNSNVQIIAKLDCNVNMPEIVISDRRIGVILRGDTIKYNIAQYSDGSENNLGDVLKNLPGITVSSTNQIEFKGKRIDALLIEGKNILNNQHQLANEGISAKDILSIQIIENYESFSHKIFQGLNEQTALNVELKEEAKSRLKGNIEFKGGYKNKYDAILSLFKVSTHKASTTFFRSNNIGKQLISQNDFMSLQTNLQRHNQPTLTDIDKTTSSTFNFTNDIYFNKDVLLSQNGEFSSDSNKLITRYSFLASMLNRGIKNDLMQFFFIQNYKVNINEKIDTEIYFGNAQFTLEYKQSKKLRYSFDLHSDYKLPSIFSMTSTNFENANFYSTTKNVSKMINVNPQFYSKYEFDKHWSVKFQYNFSFNKIKEDNLIIDNKGIFQNNIFLLNQKVKNTNLKHDFTINLFYESPFVDIGLRQFYQNNFDDYNLSHDISLTGFIDGSSLLKESISTLNSFITFKYKGFSISPSFSYNYKINRVLNNYNLNMKRFNSALMFKYAYGKVNFALLKYSTGYKFAQHNLMYNLNYIQNSRNIIINQILPEQLTNSRIINFSHLYLNLVNKSKLYLNFQIVNFDNPIIISNKAKNNYFEKAAIVAKLSESINVIGNFNLNHYDFPISIFGNINFNKLKTVFLDRPTSDIYNLNIDAGLVSKVNHAFHLETSCGYTRNKMNFGIVSTGIFHSKFCSLDAKYIFEEIQINASITISRNYLGENYINTVNNLNAKVRIPFNENFVFHLQGANLLNLRGNKNTNFSNTDFFEELRMFSSFPGFFIMGLEYRL